MVLVHKFFSFIYRQCSLRPTIPRGQNKNIFGNNSKNKLRTRLLRIIKITCLSVHLSQPVVPKRLRDWRLVYDKMTILRTALLTRKLKFFFSVPPGEINGKICFVIMLKFTLTYTYVFYEDTRKFKKPGLFTQNISYCHACMYLLFFPLEKLMVIFLISTPKLHSLAMYYI